jgi:hypothetical protein
MLAVIPPPSGEASNQAFRGPTSDITEDVKAGVHPYHTDVYITEDSDRDSKYIARAMSDMLKRWSHMSKK